MINAVLIIWLCAAAAPDCTLETAPVALNGHPKPTFFATMTECIKGREDFLPHGDLAVHAVCAVAHPK
jgi:hypothetical protein